MRVHFKISEKKPSPIFKVSTDIQVPSHVRCSLKREITRHQERFRNYRNVVLMSKIAIDNSRFQRVIARNTRGLAKERSVKRNTHFFLGNLDLVKPRNFHNRDFTMFGAIPRFTCRKDFHHIRRAFRFGTDKPHVKILICTFDIIAEHIIQVDRLIAIALELANNGTRLVSVIRHPRTSGSNPRHRRLARFITHHAGRT